MAGSPPIFDEAAIKLQEKRVFMRAYVLATVRAKHTYLHKETNKPVVSQREIAEAMAEGARLAWDAIEAESEK